MKPYSTLYITFGHTDPGTSYTWYEVTYISPTKVQAVGTLPSDYTGTSYCLRADWGRCYSVLTSVASGIGRGSEAFSKTITLPKSNRFTVGMWIKLSSSMNLVYDASASGFSRIK
jgi:hypothetical protein